MTTWELVRWLHLVAMAFFVGGQLVLVAAIVPAFRGAGDRERLRAIARRFATGSLAALVVLLATGWAMADRFGQWDEALLHAKLGLVAAAVVLVVWHIRRPARHWIEGLLFADSLVIVWLGVSLAH